MTFLEACAAGTPIITTKNVNPNNAVTKYQLGIVTETHNELLEAVRKDN